MTIEIPEVFSFERKLSTSDALMHAGNWDKRKDSMNWSAISIQEKAVRGTTSNRLKNAQEGDPAKLDTKVENPNLQRVDVATLPFFDADTLKVSFTLRVLGNLAMPSACNKPIYQEKLIETINGYIEEHKFDVLACRYAENLANGRFLWRNRVGAEDIEVRIAHIKDNKEQTYWIFNGHDFNLRNFSEPSKDLDALVEVIRQGLSGPEESFVFLRVEAFSRLGVGQEVFPSQELVLGDSRNKKGKKSKFLYSVGDTAALHSQKVGNAIRTIDTWYPGADELGPIAVEPYGSVTNRGKAYRLPKEKLDFYTLLDGWIVKGKTPPVEQQHYVMATLVRGGVFGKKAD